MAFVIPSKGPRGSCEPLHSTEYVGSVIAILLLNVVVIAMTVDQFVIVKNLVI